MSILIRGVEMPECDNALVLVIFRDGSVYQHGTITRSLIRIKGAQAVPVPAPHGRLVDEKAVIENLLTLKADMDGTVYAHIEDIFSKVYSAPTVVESEE